MKKVSYVLLAVACVCFLDYGIARAAQHTLVYHTLQQSGAGREVIAETTITFKDLADNKTSLTRRKTGASCAVHDDFVLDRDDSLERWHRVCPCEDTDVLSVKEGGELIVTGKLQGKAIDKKISLGRKYLHIYPEYSLRKFVLSNLKKLKFWTLRRDEMSKLPMQATKKGTETITVNGKEIETIKLYYSIGDKLRRKHYHRNFYYRKSDGLLIRKEWPDGKIEDLVSEQ